MKTKTSFQAITRRRGLLASAAILIFAATDNLKGQGQPDILWEAPTPSGLANSILGAGWSPVSPDNVAVGSTDRWVRVRNGQTGQLLYSVLQPHRSGSADQTIYSTDGGLIAVHNSSGGLGYRVHRASDGLFLGSLTVTIDSRGLVIFAPDSQLLGATGGDGTLSRWKIADFRVVLVTGSGYDRVTTTFNFSPDGVLQSAASQGAITLRRRTDGSIFRTIKGGALKSSVPVAFTPDSKALAVWAPSPNQVTLWRLKEGLVGMRFPGAAPEEGVGAIRFTPDGLRMVTTGYLPYVDADGLWQQKGIIRFWRVLDGALRAVYDQHTGLAVTSPVAWSPGATRFLYGTYEGTAVAAITPPP